MKTCIISPSLKVKGGISSVVGSHIESLRKNNVIVKNFYTYKGGYKNLGNIFYSIFQAIKYIFIKKNEDIIHIHSAANGSFLRKTYYAIVSKMKGESVVFHIHGSRLEKFLGRSNFNKRIATIAFRNSDKIIVLSDNMKQVIKDYCSIDKIEIVKNPVSVPKNYTKRKRNSSKLNFLFLGEVGDRKGIFDLIEALHNMRNEKLARIQLHIGGNGEIDRLVKLIEKYNLESICKVHGWIVGNQKEELLKEADVYVLPSHNEGLPISILEAMAYKLPVISTFVGGIPEIIHDKQNGLLFNAGNIEELKIAIEYLIDNETLIEPYGLRGYEIVSEYDSEKVATDLIKIYSNIGEKSYGKK